MSPLQGCGRCLAALARQAGGCCQAAAAAAGAGGAAGPAAAWSAAVGQGAQQACGRQHPLFAQLAAAQRRCFAAAPHHPQQPFFQPTRLYPRQRSGSEAVAFWGLVALNGAVTLAAKADQPELRAAVLRHFRASVEAVADGRLHTLVTSSVCHTSAVHCAMNLLMLLLYRHTQPLTARELLALYFLGGLVASCTHVAWCWWDASGPEFGLRYALNTPGLLGCSGAVAAVSAYKAALEPLGVPRLVVPLPVPIFAATGVFCCLYVREAEYSDYVGKFGAAAFGVAAALAAVASGRRRLAWRQH